MFILTYCCHWPREHTVPRCARPYSTVATGHVWWTHCGTNDVMSLFCNFMLSLRRSSQWRQDLHVWVNLRRIRHLITSTPRVDTVETLICKWCWPRVTFDLRDRSAVTSIPSSLRKIYVDNIIKTTVIACSYFCSAHCSVSLEFGSGKAFAESLKDLDTTWYTRIQIRTLSMIIVWTRVMLSWRQPRSR